MVKPTKKSDAKLTRCSWCGDDPLYVSYHDNEWGVPVRDDRKHFEFLTLEGAQAGLSWVTILRRREGYRKAFDRFDPQKVARYPKRKVESLLKDEGIIRNRLKVESTVNNAKQFLKVQEEFGTFDRYIWDFVDGKPVVNKWRALSDIPASTDLSDRVTKDLKQRGFKFVGTTVIYAHLQASGLVNDHITGCFRYREIIDSY